MSNRKLFLASPEKVGYTKFDKTDTKEIDFMSVVNITSENYDEIAVRGSKKVLLDFWASWCGPCRMVAPIVEQIAQERSDIIVGKVNVDEQMALAMEFGIASIPTLVVVQSGEIRNKAIGYMPKEEILALLD